jgi:hypothetical protein
MKIENKELYNLFRSLFKTGKIDGRYGDGRKGLFLEGFDGGVNAYVTDNHSVYRKTFYGDNKDVFIRYFSKWTEKDGLIDACCAGDNYNKEIMPFMKSLFDQERFGGFTVPYKEFKKAVRGVDVINRGEKTHNIILSVHNGKFDLASRSGAGDTAAWQLDGEYTGNGAVCLDKKHLDCLKTGDRLEFSYSDFDGKTLLHAHGDIDAVVLTEKIDNAEFMDIVDYEYQKPQKPAVKTVTAAVPAQPVVKPVQEFRVSGVTFDKRQEALQHLTAYEPKDVHTYLVPEYDNEYDKNAIAVYVLVNNSNCSYRLGYIPKTDTAIAKNYIGKIPALKILDGDILGARLVFDRDETITAVEPVIEQAQVTAVEPAIIPVITDKPVKKTAKRTPRPKMPEVSIRERASVDPALLGWKGWTWNPKKLVWTKVCNW